MKRSGIIGLLLLLIAVPYIPNLDRRFVYDDHGSIEENAFIQDPSNAFRVLGLQTLADPTVPDGRRPMAIFSYFVERGFWGLHPLGYHITNLLLHLLACWLLLCLIGRVTRQRPVTFFGCAAALLFGLHPVLTEAVLVPAFREDLLVTVFILLYLLASLEEGRVRWLSLPLLFFALLSKESAVIAPLLLFSLWLRFPSTRPSGNRDRVLLGVGALIVCGLLLVWRRSGSFQAASEEWATLGVQFPRNLYTAPWLWIKNLHLLAWPHPLQADYVIDGIARIGDPRALLGLAALVAWIVVAILSCRAAPWISFGMSWVLIAFIPTSNLVPLFNPFAERYLYLSAVGFALLAAFIVSRIPTPRIRAGVLGALCAVYGFATIDRAPDWYDDMTLWTKTLATEPRSSRAHTWIGLELKKRGDLPGALQHFTEANALNTNDIAALINIAIIQGQAGQLDNAVTLLQEAVRRRPDKVDAYWNLSVAYRLQGNTAEACWAVEKVLQLDPRHPLALAAKQELKAEE